MSSQDNSYSSTNEEIVRSLDAIKARAEGATVGPWEVDPHADSENGAGIHSKSDCVIEGGMEGNYPCSPVGVNEEADAQFIAHSRADIPALVAAVEAVLELHKPITDDGNSLRNWLGMYDGKPRDYCNECEVDGYTAVPYPCPTVTAIQSELGEEDE